ncbi:MAG: hypothetical protein M3N47_05130 [Chloroflexota bacterium]|nr:hypothetical protein [Chloroflexota bacterium]
MRIGPDGLAFKGVWRTSHQAWDEIDRFVAFDVRAGYIKRRLVGYILRETDPGRRSRRRFGRGLYSVDRVVPDTYGRDPDELAALLQDYRDRYAAP